MGLWEEGWLRFPSFDAPKNTPPTCTPLYSNSPYLSLKLRRLVTARIMNIFVGNPNPNLYWPLLLGWGCTQLGTICNQVACWYCLKTSGWYIHHVSSWWVAYNPFIGQVPFIWCIICLWWCLTQVHGNFHNPVSFLRKKSPAPFWIGAGFYISWCKATSTFPMCCHGAYAIPSCTHFGKAPAQSAATVKLYTHFPQSCISY